MLPLRIGILGTAKIARQFILGVSSSSLVEVAAVASRDRRRAEEFTREFGVQRYSASYEDLLADSNVDAIYNPLPNSLHADWSSRAAKAGKHVLCEKPLAATAEEAASMIRAAQDAGVYLVEAYPYRSQPLTIKLREILAARKIGEVSLIRADFGFRMTDESNIRLNPSLKGGSLWDAGCYPVSLATMVAGGRPSRVYATATWAKTGVDQSMAATLEFKSGLVAQVSCSFNTAPHRQATIAGTEGVIETEYLNHTPPAVFQIKRGFGAEAVVRTIEAPPANGFLAEAESFAELVRDGWDQWNGVTNEESMDILVTLEAILLSARSGKPVDIAD